LLEWPEDVPTLEVPAVGGFLEDEVFGKVLVIVADETDDSENQADTAPLPPEGVEAVVLAVSAKTAFVDALGGHAGSRELRTILLHQVEVAPPSRARTGDAVDVPSALGKSRDHLVSDLVAADADRGADGRLDILDRGAVDLVESRDGSRRDPGERPAPAGVNGGDGLRLRGPEEQGNAVRALHKDTDSALVGKEPVAPSNAVTVEDLDVVPVNLMHSRDSGEPQDEPKPLAVSLSVLAGAEGAGTKGETMRDALLQKRRALEELDAFELRRAEPRRAQAMLRAGAVELSAFSYWLSRSPGFMPLSMCAHGRTSSRGRSR